MEQLVLHGTLNQTGDSWFEHTHSTIIRSLTLNLLPPTCFNKLPLWHFPEANTFPESGVTLKKKSPSIRYKLLARYCSQNVQVFRLVHKMSSIDKVSSLRIQVTGTVALKRKPRLHCPPATSTSTARRFHTLSSSWMTKLPTLSKGEPGLPAENTYFGDSYLGAHSFVMTVRDGTQID